MHTKMKALLALLVVLAFSAPLVFLLLQQDRTPSLVGAAATVTVPATVVVPTTASDHAEITVAVTGNILAQLPLIESAFNEKSDSYSFDKILAPVGSYLEFADYTVAPLGTAFVEGQSYEYYPRKNAPPELASTLKGVGVDLATIANANVLDYGFDGVLSTTATLRQLKINTLGTWLFSQDGRVLVATMKGIKVGFLDYTTKLPASKNNSQSVSFSVSKYDTKQVKADLAIAKAQGADVVVAFLDSGTPFGQAPTDEQTRVSEELLSLGVDVVAGSGPHVVQTISHVLQYEGTNVKDKYIVYSQGNLLSSESWRNADSGVVIYIKIRRDGNRVSVTGLDYLPTYVQRAEQQGKTSYRVVPVLPGLQPNTDIPLTASDQKEMNRVWEEARLLISNPNENIKPLDVSETGAQ